MFTRIAITVALTSLLLTFSADARPGGGCCRADDRPACCMTTANDAERAEAPGPRRGGRGPRWQREARNTASDAARPLPHKRELMQDAHALVFNHQSIARTIDDIPNGVKTVTTTTDPELLKILQRHPREMGDLYAQGGRVRAWDPLFTELSAVANEITMTVTKIEDGVEVVSTSSNPEVVKLIRAHARKVNEFVNRGRAAMREATPLPEDYRRDASPERPQATTESAE